MASPELITYIKARAKFFSNLTKPETKAYDELLVFLEKTTNNLEAKQDQITSESNEYERQYTSFFALAISFIVAGMLTNIPGTEDRLAVRLFFFSALVSALSATVFLFLEYISVRSFFSKWSKHTSETLKYISEDKWDSPADLEKWMNNHDTNAPIHSTIWLLVMEIILISTSLILLACWLIEVLFNPNWPYFLP